MTLVIIKSRLQLRRSPSRTSVLSDWCDTLSETESITNALAVSTIFDEVEPPGSVGDLHVDKPVDYELEERVSRMGVGDRPYIPTCF